MVKKALLRFFGIDESHAWVFLAAFSVVMLINVNYFILRSVRNTLTVSLSSVGAQLIPAIQFWALLPLTFLLVWAIGALMRRYRLSSVFHITTFFFVTFFLLFSLFVFPHREFLHRISHSAWLTEMIPSLGHLAENWTVALYYVMAELWKVAVLSVLFFGFLNRRLSLNAAKGLYSPILLGGSIGGLLAGPLTVFCSQMGQQVALTAGGDKWQASFLLMSTAIFFIGLCIMGLFTWLKSRLQAPNGPEGLSGLREKPLTITLFQSLKAITQSRYLFSLSMMVIFEYLAYYLYEIFFLDLLKKVYPDPNSYCSFNGQLVFWGCLLTIFSALFVTPVLVRRCSWKVPALISPLIVFIFSMAFFTTAIFHTSPFIQTVASSLAMVPMQLAMILGALCFCLARAAKSTAFDVSKELAFIPLPSELQSKGKLIVDGLASRTGCSMAAAVNEILFSLFATIEAGMPCAAMISCGAVVVWVRSVLRIDRSMKRKDLAVLSEA